MDAQLLGLFYDINNPSQTEAINTFIMYTENRSKIVNYEKMYGVPIDGTQPTEGDRISAANAKFAATLSLAGLAPITSLEINLNTARMAYFDYLRNHYADNQELVDRFTDEIKSTSVYLNPNKQTDTNRSYVMDARKYETGNYSVTGTNDLMIGLDHKTS